MDSPTVYVKFAPNTTGVFRSNKPRLQMQLLRMSSLTGIGINPYIQDFNDVNVLTNSGWTAYSVTGDRIKWASTTSRFNSSPAAVQMNGFLKMVLVKTG
jgi:hypothetical protein